MIDIFLEKELIVINLEELILVIFHVVGSELYKRDCTPCAVMEIIRIVEKRRVAPTWKRVVSILLRFDEIKEVFVACTKFH